MACQPWEIHLTLELFSVLIRHSFSSAKSHAFCADATDAPKAKTLNRESSWQAF